MTPAYLRDALAIAWRDILRNARQGNQILGAAARPLVWTFIIGSGLSAGFAGLFSGYTFRQYAFPGIVAMNILFTGIMAGASIVWDREFGFLKAIMASPASRISILLGKLLGGTAIATVHGLVALAFFPLLGIKMTVVKALFLFLAMFLTAAASSSTGILLASIVRTIEGFGNVHNFLAMPLFALSGAMFPLERSPDWLRYLSFADPFTYAIDLIRGIMLGIDFSGPADIAELGLFALLAFALAVHRLIK